MSPSPVAALPRVSFTLKHGSIAAGQVRAALADGGPPAASAAFAAFGTLHTVCGSAIGAINAGNFGPFSNSGSCNYDCGFKTQNWSWSADYTAWVQQTVVPVVQGMDVSGAFTNAFAPAQQWVTADLPGYSTHITNAIATINQIDAVIKNTGTATPAQQQALAQAFATALSQVQSSLNEANAALQTLSSFLTWATGRSISPQPYQTAVDNAITTGMNNLIGQIACGAGDVQGQFGAMQSVVDASFGSLQTPFNNVNSQYNTATNAGDVVAGVFLNIQTDSQSVTDFLTRAQGVSPTSPLRGGFLDIAATDWAALVTYAQTQLST